MHTGGFNLFTRSEGADEQEFLPDRQFAVYARFHPAALDGVGTAHLLRSMWSTDPNGRIHYSPLSMAARDRYVATFVLMPRPSRNFVTWRRR
nr:wax ester/triacylglycerol synthase domain-containing protein [Seongchinamella unica]